VAEAVKLFEGLYRDVNIALVNELARFTDELGIDVNEAINMANTSPYVDLHAPGPGVGGHCIPYYPYFLIEPFETEAPYYVRLVKSTMGCPEFTVEKLHEEFEAEGRELTNATVLVFGLTYRPGVNEIRATPALPITEQLAERDADVRLVDPVWTTLNRSPALGLGLTKSTTATRMLQSWSHHTKRSMRSIGSSLTH